MYSKKFSSRAALPLPLEAEDLRLDCGIFGEVVVSDERRRLVGGPEGKHHHHGKGEEERTTTTRPVMGWVERMGECCVGGW